MDSTPHLASSQPGRERRKFVRLNFSADIRYSIVPTPDRRLAKTQNIGAGGICLLADQKLNPGDVLKLEILLPQENQTISASGRVAWTKLFSIAGDKNRPYDRYDIGVEFIALSDTDREKIKKHVFCLR